MGRYKWIDFLSHNNTLLITNEKEFNSFKRFLNKLGIVDILGNNTDYIEWKSLARINNTNPNSILFEYDNYKGLTFGSTIEESKNYYGVNPLIVDDLEILNISKTKSNIDRVR